MKEVRRKKGVREGLELLRLGGKRREEGRGRVVTVLFDSRLL